MRKFILSLFALTLSVGLWAETQTVSNRYPVYNTDGDVTSGIKEWKIGEVEATVVTNTTQFLYLGWYVVTGADVQTGTLTCQGNVHLILADGAKLTANGDYHNSGIRVSDTDNSLTIYGQTAQAGQLITNGGDKAAGIGGGGNSQIGGSGLFITINGGTVTANGGGDGASGIGGGFNSSSSNIKVATTLVVKAGKNENLTEVIAAERTADTDIAFDLRNKQFASITINLTACIDAAIAAINATIAETDNDNIKAIATNAATAINAAVSVEAIDAIKAQALAAIASAKAAYTEGEAEALGAMATPCTDCPTVDVTKGTTTIRLYSPEKVEFRKME